MSLDSSNTPVGADSESASTACEQQAPNLCRCFGVSKATVLAAISGKGLRSVDEVTACTDAGGACTGCHRGIRLMLAEHHCDPALAEPPRRRGQ